MRSTSKFLFFWTKRDYLSQWFPCSFEYKGFEFSSAEQFMMFSKAVIFTYQSPNSDELHRILASERVEVKRLLGEIEEPSKVDVVSLFPPGSIGAIMETNNPKIAKDQGRLVPNFVKADWDLKVIGIIRAGNRFKFSQNPELLERFLATAPLQLVEASPSDKIYGIGMRDSHPDAENPSKWRGTNHLGNILTELRSELLND